MNYRPTWLFALLFVLLAESGPISAQTVTEDTLTWQRYFPLHTGNEWEYRDEESFPLTRLKVVDDTTFEGQVYYKMVESIYEVVYPSNELERVEKNIHYAHYDTSGKVVRILDEIQGQADSTEHFNIGKQDFRYFDLTMAFGTTSQYGDESHEEVRVRGGYQDTVAVGDTMVVVDARKSFTYPVVEYSLASGIGFLGGGNLSGPQLEYAKVGDKEFGSRIISVGSVELGMVPKSLKLNKIYPNPARDHINISVKSPSVNRVKLDVVDLLGREYYYQEILLKIGTSSHKLAIDNLSSGYYVLRLTAEKSGVIARGFIVQ